MKVLTDSCLEEIKLVFTEEGTNEDQKRAYSYMEGNFCLEHRVKSSKITLVGNFGVLRLNTKIQTEDFKNEASSKNCFDCF